MNYELNSYRGFVVNIGLTSIMHPTVYVKTLIQIGYEPIAPKLSKGIIGPNYYTYPHLFRYLKHIREVDGFLGMYRGIGPHMMNIMTRNYCSMNLHKAFSYFGFQYSYDKPQKESMEEEQQESTDEQEEEEVKPTRQKIVIMLSDTMIELCIRSITVVVSHPFQVIMVRSMAEFIGRETKYSGGFLGSITEIYNADGIKGFFSGIVPLLLSEAALVVASNITMHIFMNWIIPHVDKIDTFSEYFENQSNLKSQRPIISVLTNLAFSSYLYKYKMISNVMIVKDSSLLAGQNLGMGNCLSWNQCLDTLIKEDQYKRGASMFMRTVPKSHLIARNLSI